MRFPVLAFLVLLESLLSPTERAVFLLHEVFGYDFRRSPTSPESPRRTVEQIFARLEQHVDQGGRASGLPGAARRGGRRFEAAGGGRLNGCSSSSPRTWSAGRRRRGQDPAPADARVGPGRPVRSGCSAGRRTKAPTASPALVNGQPARWPTRAGWPAVLSLEIADGRVQAIRSRGQPRQAPAPRADLRPVPAAGPGLAQAGHGHRRRRRPAPRRSWKLREHAGPAAAQSC